MRRFAATVGLVIAALVSAASAFASPPPAALAVDAIDGCLDVTFVATPSGCVSNTAFAIPRTLIAGSGGVVYDLTFDGEVRTVVWGDTGPTIAGCLAGPNPGCTRLRPSGLVTALVGRPGDPALYARVGTGIAVLRRDATTGQLSQPAGSAGCVAPRGAGGCLALPVAVGDLQLSADGRRLLVASSSRIDVLAVDPSSGELTGLAAPAGCITATGAGSCSRVPRLADGSPFDLPAAAGSSIYLQQIVAGDFTNGYRLIHLELGSSGWTDADPTDACLYELQCGSSAAGGRLVPDPGGRALYVVSYGEVVELSRSTATGALTLLGCLGAYNCATDPQIGSVAAVSLGPANTVQVATPTGVLSYRVGGDGSLARIEWSSLPPDPAIDHLRSFSVSPDGTVAYGAGGTHAWRFIGEVPPICATTAAIAYASSTTAVDLRCRDRNGDPISMTVTSGPAHGTADVRDDGTLTYVPTDGFVGEDRVTLGASDGTLATTDEVILDVHPVPTLTASASAKGLSKPSTIGSALTYIFPVGPGGVRVSGRLLEADGAPIADVRIAVTVDGLDHFTTTAVDGSYNTKVATTVNIGMVVRVPTIAAVEPVAIRIGVLPGFGCDRYYVVVRGQMVVSCRIVFGHDFGGHFELQRRRGSKWKSTRRLSIEVDGSVMARVPARDWRGPWRLLYLPDRARYVSFAYALPFSRPRGYRH